MTAGGGVRHAGRMSDLDAVLSGAIAARQPLLDEPHEGAVRLLNGFLEGWPTLVLDVYATTLVVHDYADERIGDEATVRAAAAAVRSRLPWVETVLWKVRNAPSHVCESAQPSRL